MIRYCKCGRAFLVMWALHDGRVADEFHDLQGPPFPQVDWCPKCGHRLHEGSMLKESPMKAAV